MRILALYSDPSHTLRLDREDRAFTQLLRTHPGTLTLDRLHASTIDDINQVLISNNYDIIHFGGHGSPHGVLLERSHYGAPGPHFVSAEKLVSLIDITERAPRLIVLLSCYSDSQHATLAQAAPFVVTALGCISDTLCLDFVDTFYAAVLGGLGFEAAHRRSLNVLQTKGHTVDHIRLARRAPTQNAQGRFIYCKPDPRLDSVPVDLTAVLHQIGTMGMSEAELCHALERRLKVHYRVFGCPREKALIPIENTLYGEFTWQDAKDVVHCTNLFVFRADIPRLWWYTWSNLLMSYNELASLEYRSKDAPADPRYHTLIQQAVNIFSRNVRMHLLPSCEAIESLGFARILPSVDQVHIACQHARDQIDVDRYPEAVALLEQALMSFHNVVDALSPPVQNTPSDGTT